MDELEFVSLALPPAITLVARRVGFDNKYVTLYDDEVMFADGRQGTYVRVVESQGMPGVACVVTHASKIALVLVYRYPTASWEWGIPRGFAAGDNPIESLLMELDEELGGEPESVVRLGDVTPNSGLLAGEVAIFHATWPSTQANPRDTQEVRAVKWVSLRDLGAGIREGVVKDAITLAALTLLREHGVLSE
ncbi:MAG: NUDIX hydrolase [Nocardioidaceae bacterium]